MYYAPVVIPTINRHEHLKRLLDSLKKNKGIEHTKIIISVDYPPSEKYEDGYNKIILLLKEYDFSFCEQVTIFYQDNNLGAIQNFYFLIERVKEMGCSRVVYTEDDNEFAPNFLQYMNKGLELFEEDKDIIRICGATDTNYKSDGNILYLRYMPAYGIGIWINKDIENMYEGEKVLFSKQSFAKMISFLRKSPRFFKYYIKYILLRQEKSLFIEGNKLHWSDTVWTIYMHLSDKMCVVPVKPKSRTWGKDGSGNMPYEEDYLDSMPILDEGEDFEFNLPTEKAVSRENEKKARAFFRRNARNTGVVFGLLYYFYYLITPQKVKGRDE